MSVYVGDDYQPDVDAGMFKEIGNEGIRLLWVLCNLESSDDF